MIRNLIVLLSFVILPASWVRSQSTRISTGWEFHKGDLGGIWEALRPTPPGSAEEQVRWTAVSIPHSFNSEDAVNPDTQYYQGPGWYRISLPINNPHPNGRTLLFFEGSGQVTDVYVHDKKVETHVGGYDEWTVDITDAVREFNASADARLFNGVPITIRCDNSRDLERIPSALSDFTVYGGLYRYVSLHYKPAIYLTSIRVTPHVSEKLSHATLHASATLNTESKKATISFALRDPGNKLVASKDITLTQDLKPLKWDILIRKPLLWSPDAPNHYTLVTTVSSDKGTDIQTTLVGFRNFQFVNHGPFMLNGERLLLKGTHRHEDHAGIGNALTTDLMRKEMVMIKEMGANFIRLGHYQQSRTILNLCDSLGILVWEEIPWCRGGLGGERYKDQARRMLSNMINQHYNHPSVIIWGLGNENDWPGDFSTFNKEAIREFMSELNQLAHRLDSTRKTAIRRCDFCKDIVDVYSPSIWSGWYRGRFEEYATATKKEFDKVDHMLHTEWGGDSHAGRHSEAPEEILTRVPVGKGADERSGDALSNTGLTRFSKDGDWSETYICDLVDWYLKEQSNMPWLTGTAAWTFKDFSTPLRPDNPIPFVNQKGAVARDLTKKEVYYVFQSYWSKKPMVHIYGHSWPVRWGKAGEAKTIKVYSNCDEVELFVNNKSYGTRQRSVSDYPAAGFHWNVAFATGKNTIRAVAKKDRQVLQDEIIQQYQTESWKAPAQLVISVVSIDDAGIVFEVHLKDEKNVTCLDARNWITFALVGDGRLESNLGTAGGSSHVQATNGRARIKVYHCDGSSVLSVKSPGLVTVFKGISNGSVAP